MKEPLFEKLKRLLHGTIFFPHIKRDSTEGKWCTCGWRETPTKTDKTTGVL